jgi:UrcA family protein
MKTLGAVFAAAILFATPALAGDASPATGPQPVSIKVSTAGLDLSRQSDVMRLRGRVNQAIADACNPNDSYYAQLTPDHDCVIKFRGQTDAIVQKMAMRASSSRYVQN